MSDVAEEFKPLLPPVQFGKYTLVLDLDETLVHYESKKKQYHIRPGCRKFLKELSKYYEIVVFTASVAVQADYILDEIDPKYRLIKFRLYRNHTIFSKTTAIKDLNRLGRPLEQTLIIDNKR